MTKRDYLQSGTWIRIADGEIYRITGDPLGEGGGSIVYPCERMRWSEEGYSAGTIKYAMKECFPVSAHYTFVRNAEGEIVPKELDRAAEQYLQAVKEMQLGEFSKAETIYNTSARMVPVLSGANKISISKDEGKTYAEVNNAISIMPSLELKGQALRNFMNESKGFSAVTILQITKLILLAVKEIHDAGYLHLDIQDGNLFVKGSLGEENLVSLIDFGSARKLLPDGFCEVITDGVIFSTDGFSAPEIAEGNDGTLRLGKEADLYSIGYTLLLMLTGKRYSLRELASLDIGYILSGRMLKRRKLPAHMADKLRQILTKSLQKSPADRYHSCEEMLEDISTLIDALTPYQSSISQVVYDAFISYRHNETDSAAAMYLQECLEHFRCPKGTPSGKRKINRVFVDEGELSSCADFGLQIREALKNAEWLIVICSSKTKESPWVNLEIRTFLEYHDRSHILAMIVEGEPEEVFPAELLGHGRGDGEVLAADARGADLDQIKKRIKKDSVLRIAAPILGLPYDTLKQRRRQYILRRAAAGTAAAFVLLNAFVLYSMNKNMEIREQNRRLELNAAENKLRQAEAYLSQGKIESSLQAVLSITDDQEQPLLPEENYILNSALHTYCHQENPEGFRPEREIELEDDPDESIRFNSDGSIMFCIDDSGNAYFWDTETFTLLWKYPIVESQEDSNPLVKEYVQWDFISDEELLIVKNNALVRLNPVKQTAEEESLAMEYQVYSSKTCSLENGVLAIVGSWPGQPVTLYLHDYKDDRTRIVDLSGTYEFAGFEGEVSKSLGACLSADGKAIAIYNASEYKLMIDAAKEEKPEGPNGILVVDLPSGNSKVLHTDDYIYLLDFISDQEIVTIESALTVYGEATAKTHLYEKVYNPEKGKVFESDSHYFVNAYLHELSSISFHTKIDELSSWSVGAGNIDEMRTGVFLCCGKHLIILDQDDYSVLLDKTFDRNIQAVSVYNGREIIIGLSDGSAGCLKAGSYVSVFSVHKDLIQSGYCAERDMLIQLPYDEKSLIVSKIQTDDSMQLVEDEAFELPYYEQEEEIVGSEKDYHAVLTDDSIEVYEAEEDEPILSVPVKYNTHSLPLFSFFNEDSQLLVYTQDNMLALWDIASGELLSFLELNLDNYLFYAIVTDSEGRYFTLHMNEGTIAYSNDTSDLLMRASYMFSVDEDNQMHFFAEIPFGAVDFEEGLVYTTSRYGNRYYAGPIHSYAELRAEAEKVLAGEE